MHFKYLSIALLLMMVACKDENKAGPATENKVVTSTPTLPKVNPTPAEVKPVAPAVEEPQEEAKPAVVEPKATPVEKKSELSKMVQEFLAKPSSLEDYEGNPIDKFLALAQAEAKESISINADNLETNLQKCKSAQCVLTTENHTIVKILNIEDCKPSGKWKACMPKGEGYIRKKGALQEQEDYINNIIGLPDQQKRSLFLF